MTGLAKLISQANARSLASMDQPAFVNDVANPDRYFTYPDVAREFGISGTEFLMSEGENDVTGLLEYSNGSWPVIKSRKMFPRV